MKNIIYIALTLLLGSSAALADKPTKATSDNSYKKSYILEKGVKREVLLPKDGVSGDKVSSMQAKKATSKDGIVVQFNNPDRAAITAFEATYGLKLQHKLVSGYYIFDNVSGTPDIQVVESIINNETNVQTVKPNWKMTNKPQ